MSVDGRPVRCRVHGGSSRIPTGRIEIIMIVIIGIYFCDGNLRWKTQFRRRITTTKGMFDCESVGLNMRQSK